MKRSLIPLFPLLLWFFVLTDALTSALPAQQFPERSSSEKGTFPPFQVTLYADANYQKPYATWTLAPGMRMLRIPEIKPAPKSIALGSQVAMILFPQPDFSSIQTTVHGYKVGWEGDKANVTYSLIPYTRLRGSTPLLNPIFAADSGFSLVLYRLDVDDMLGVYLTMSSPLALSGQFYPLPERAADTVVTFDRIPEGGPLKLIFIAAATGQLSTYGTPSPKDLEITIRTPQMAELKLPEPDGQTIEYNLNDLGVQKQISFMKLRYVGPIREQDYTGPTRVRAPAAPEIQAQMLNPLPAQPAAGKEAISLTGTWQSNIGAEYIFVPSETGFTWVAASLGQQGTVAIDGMKITTQWTGGGAGGMVGGKITEVDPSGAARRIEWENGVVIYRQAAAPLVVDLAGDWKGFMNMTFSFTQNGNQFTWSVQATGEKAQGTIAGDELTVAWTNAQGSGTAKGKIVTKDAAGRATRINWDNGAVFSR